MFVILAKKLGSRIAPEDGALDSTARSPVGRDIEGMVGRAWRTSLLAGADHVTREALAEWSRSSCRRRRGLEPGAAGDGGDSRVLPIGSSCPPANSRKDVSRGGRAQLQSRLTALKQIVREL
jgi:hypothetical protein